MLTEGIEQRPSHPSSGVDQTVTPPSRSSTGADQTVTPASRSSTGADQTMTPANPGVCQDMNSGNSLSLVDGRKATVYVLKSYTFLVRTGSAMTIFHETLKEATNGFSQIGRGGSLRHTDVAIKVLSQVYYYFCCHF